MEAQSPSKILQSSTRQEFLLQPMFLAFEVNYFGCPFEHQCSFAPAPIEFQLPSALQEAYVLPCGVLGTSSNERL